MSVRFSPVRGAARLFLAVAALTLAAWGDAKAAELKEIRLDFATYNPVSLVLKDQGLLERDFAKDGIAVRWVQSLGCNRGKTPGVHAVAFRVLVMPGSIAMPLLSGTPSLAPT
jgi:hypothetical protein